MGRAHHLADFGYFYDALSGEFLPPSDPYGQTHTLGRLMLATFKNGQISNPRSFQETRQYRPSWALISSVVSVSHDDDIRSLTLIGYQNDLRIVHSHDQDTRGIQVFTEDTAIPAFRSPLPGKSYKDTQNAVSGLAQEFFNNNPGQ